MGTLSLPTDPERLSDMGIGREKLNTCHNSYSIQTKCLPIVSVSFGCGIAHCMAYDGIVHVFKAQG